MGIKVIFLCAGYGTRLERDIVNCPEGDASKNLLGVAKGMLPIGDQPLISHWMNLFGKNDEFDHFYIVTNAKFYSQFSKLTEKYGLKISLINDGTTCNEDRMGAVASIDYAIEKFSLRDDNILIIGGDTLFYNDFSIKEFVQKFIELKKITSKCGMVTMYTCKDFETTKYGILEVEEATQKVQSLIEKPEPHETKSRLVCPCFYLLSSDCTKLIKEFLHEKRDAPLKEKDATGHMVKYLIEKCDIFAHHISERFDVGGLESYKECDAYFCQKCL